MKYTPYEVINLLEGDLNERIYIVPQLEGQSNMVLGAKDDEGTHAEMCIEIDDLIQAFESGLKILKELNNQETKSSGMIGDDSFIYY